MTEVEAEALKPNDMLRVREEMLDVDIGSEHLDLRSVVARHGYLYITTMWLPEDTYPIQARSLASGKDMEFAPEEVELWTGEENTDG